MNHWVQLISQTAFPIVVAFFLIRWITERLNGKLDRLIQTLEDVKEEIVALRESIRSSREGR